MAVKKRKRKQGNKRKWKKGASAVLLVLLFLAFFYIQKNENNGFQQPALTVQTQESAQGEIAGEEEAPSDAQFTNEQPPETNAAEGKKEEAQPEEPGEPAEDFSLDMVPEYSGQPYADINGDVPFFKEEEITAETFQEYWDLDELGRCTGAYACVGPETLPTQKRGDISEVRPTGWNTTRYSWIDGEMLFNRCHLIGHMLTGQDANEKNLITGTRYMNTEGMLPFEESVLMYVEGTGHHVLYRVRPYYEGENLVAEGVLMEAKSVEDPLVQFCTFCYNVQPGIEIDYSTGKNRKAEKDSGSEVQRIVEEPVNGEEAGERRLSPEESSAADTGANGAAAQEPVKEADVNEEKGEEFHYVLNTNTHKFHMPYCDSVIDMKDKNKQISTEDRETLIERGYSPCKRCNP